MGLNRCWVDLFDNMVEKGLVCCLWRPLVEFVEELVKEVFRVIGADSILMHTIRL